MAQHSNANDHSPEKAREALDSKLFHRVGTIIGRAMVRRVLDIMNREQPTSPELRRERYKSLLLKEARILLDSNEVEELRRSFDDVAEDLRKKCNPLGAV